MADKIPHDLHEWIQQIQVDMAMHYDQIRKRSHEDPGTAGDQGEADWAELLTEWLPPTLQVVTKGRIIGPDGTVSPQVDVLVLKDIYPKGMRSRKLYLSDGVAAAFECKTTLRSHHITEAVEKSVKIKRLSQKRDGSPYAELHAPIIYGLLAHSHSWVQDNSRPEENVTNRLLESDRDFVDHPRDCLDLLCVADLGMWASWKYTYNLPSYATTKFGTANTAESHYGLSSARQNRPIGGLIAYLSSRLAWEIPSLRSLADYYSRASLFGGGTMYKRSWPSSIYSEPVRRRVEGGPLPPQIRGEWNEWSSSFFYF